jgi:hypothetical protein
VDSSAIAEARTTVHLDRLPAPEIAQKLISDAHCRGKPITDGQNSQVDSALAGVPANCSAWACVRNDVDLKVKDQAVVIPHRGSHRRIIGVAIRKCALAPRSLCLHFTMDGFREHLECFRLSGDGVIQARAVYAFSQFSSLPD